MTTDAIYVRVSTKDQSQASQIPELTRWEKAAEVKAQWFRETARGKSLDRPAFNLLMEGVRSGLIRRVVVWRLDRLGRSAAGMTALIEEFVSRGVVLVSIREGFDLSTPAGRLMAALMSSLAAYETEVRGERVAAGIAAAKRRGQKWSGRPKGAVGAKVKAQMKAVLELHAKGVRISQISRLTGIARPTIYTIIARQKAGAGEE